MRIETNKPTVPLYVAKIKGTDLIDRDMFWYVYVYRGEVFIDIGSYGEVLDNTYSLTIKEWNELGVNETNADFEEVE